MMLKLTFLGTSSGVPTRQRNVSGLAVQTVLGADWFLVDCGEGTQHRLQRTRLSLHDMAAVCITHVHGDHCYGLPGLLASAGMGKRTKPLKLVAPLPVWQWFEATRRLTDLHLPYEVEHVDIEADALAQVEAALQSKWRSLRVVAIEVMGCWGGAEQIAQLEAMVAARPGGQNHRVWEREAADAAAKALRRLAELRQ